MQKLEKEKIIKQGACCIHPNSKGITLIALIITIIVMLTLVGVTITVALDTGLFEKAKEAATKTEIAKEEELGLDKKVGQIINDYTGSKELITEWETTEANEEIRIYVGDEFNFIVDWGDGTIEEYKSETETGDLTHIYKTPGKYIVKIDGKIEWFDVSSESSLKKVVNWGETEVKLIGMDSSGVMEIASPTSNSFAELEDISFRFSTGLANIPEDLFSNCPNVTNFDTTFSGCTGLTSIPENLFSNCPNVTSFEATFSECTGLTSIPENLFSNCPNVTNFNSTFWRCTNLIGNPIKLWEEGRRGITETSGGEGCYENCTKLTNYYQIPEYWRTRGEPR